MEALPADALALVCARLRTPDAERLLGCSRALRAAATESLYRAIAAERRGAAFWARALARPTRRPYAGMRAELRALHAFEAALAARGLPPWTDADFAAFWAFEAAGLARRGAPE